MILKGIALPPASPQTVAEITSALANAHIQSDYTLMTTDSIVIARKSYLPLSLIQLLQSQLLAIHAPVPIRASVHRLSTASLPRFIPTGLDKLDEICCGGLRGIVELVGQSGSGKTQLAIMTALSTITSSSQIHVVWIDGSGDWSWSRARQIWLNSFASTPEAPCQTPPSDAEMTEFEQTFAKFHHFPAHDIWTCLSILDMVSSPTTELFGSGNLGLIVIDSLPSLISSLVGGPQMQGHVLLQTFGKMLDRAWRHGIVSLVINNVVSARSSGTYSENSARNSGATSVVSSDSTKPSLGATFTAIPHVSLWTEIPAPVLAMEKRRVMRQNKEGDLNFEGGKVERLVCIRKGYPGFVTWRGSASPPTDQIEACSFGSISFWITDDCIKT